MNSINAIVCRTTCFLLIVPSIPSICHCYSLPCEVEGQHAFHFYRLTVEDGRLETPLECSFARDVRQFFLVLSQRAGALLQCIDERLAFKPEMLLLHGDHSLVDRDRRGRSPNLLLTSSPTKREDAF